MFCTECGASLDANSKSCVACGTRVELEPVLDIKENVVTNALSPKTIVSGELSPRKKVIVISSVFIAVVIGCFILNAANHTAPSMTDAEYQEYLKEHPEPEQTSPNSINSINKEQLLTKIWDGYENAPGNKVSDVRDINPVGEIVKVGTVPPSARNSSADSALPAYLACYDYVTVISGAGDLKTDICVYYVENPSRGNYSVLWRGKKYIDQLESSMASDGFVSN